MNGSRRGEGRGWRMERQVKFQSVEPAVEVAVKPAGKPVLKRTGIRSRRRGFSQLETITAIAIGLIVSVIGFSGSRIFQDSLPVSSVATRFNSALSTARSMAIAHNGFFQVVLDLDERIWWIDEIPDPSAISPPPILNGAKVESPEPVDERVKIEGVSYFVAGSPVTTGRQVFIFFPDGSADRDAHITFYQIAKNPAINRNIWTVRLYGPTGSNRVFPRQRI